MLIYTLILRNTYSQVALGRSISRQSDRELFRARVCGQLRRREEAESRPTRRVLFGRRTQLPIELVSNANTIKWSFADEVYRKENSTVRKRGEEVLKAVG